MDARSMELFNYWYDMPFYYHDYNRYEGGAIVSGGSGRGYTKSPLDKRQVKARKRSKLAKQTRKKNRH